VQEMTSPMQLEGGESLKSKSNFTPPVAFISVSPPADDESSLGSDVFYNPYKKSSRAADDPAGSVEREMSMKCPPLLSEERGEVNVPVSMKVFNEEVQVASRKAADITTFVPVDKERLGSSRPEPPKKDVDEAPYFLSWILPGSAAPRAKLNEEVDRKDPPGTKTSFARTVIEHTYPSATNDKEIHGARRSAMMPSQRKTNHMLSTTWEEKSVEWDSWAPPSVMKTMEESASVPELDARELMDSDNASITSTWAPPGTASRRARAKARITSEQQHPRKLSPGAVASRSKPGTAASDVSVGSRSSFNWFPPAGSARVDFTGTISEDRSAASRSTAASRSKLAASEMSISDSSDIEWVAPNTRAQKQSKRSRDGTTQSENTDIVSLPEDVFDLIDEAAKFKLKKGSKSASESKSDEGWSGSEGESGESSEDADEYEESLASDGTSSRSRGRGDGPRPHVDPEDLEQASPTAGDSRPSDSKPKRFSSRLSSRKLVLLGVFLCIIILILAIVLPILLTKDSGNGNGENKNMEVTVPTPIPTNPPTVSPRPPPATDDLELLITSFSLDGGGSLLVTGTPQRRALNWLSGNQFLEAYSVKQIIQRYVLATLYYSTVGQGWDNINLWLSDADECKWYSSEMDNEVCNSDRELDEIDLDNNGMSGSLPWRELAILSSQVLVMDYFENDLRGRIPAQLGAFTSLLVLDL
jgi:hypothetical protein